jgi:hypothetical protein
MRANWVPGVVKRKWTQEIMEKRDDSWVGDSESRWRQWIMWLDSGLRYTTCELSDNVVDLLVVLCETPGWLR